MSTANAYEVLRTVLGGYERRPVGTASSFFHLPSELRTIIYEHLFQYPKSGMHISESSRLDPDARNLSRSPRFAILSRSIDDLFDRASLARVTFQPYWDLTSALHQDRAMFSTPVQEILTPLLVNRQFYEEAMPVFYGINRFHFGHLDDVKGSLQSLAINRRQHIAQISLEYEPHGLEPYRTSRLLLSMKGLKRLDLYVNDRRCVEASGKYKACWMPDLKGLRKLRGLVDVNLYGDCPLLRAMLKVQTLQPRNASVEQREKETFEDDEVYDTSLLWREDP